MLSVQPSAVPISAKLASDQNRRTTAARWAGRSSPHSRQTSVDVPTRSAKSSLTGAARSSSGLATGKERGRRRSTPRQALTTLRYT